ncbi:MAG: T4 prohead core scaffold protein [Candidatus Nanopelagicaceae bacterium]
MSRGDLQEMEVGTKQSKTAVNAGAKAAESMDTSIAGSYEDLGGPTPENYRSDDDSAKLKTPGKTLSQVKNVVNKGAKAADAMAAVKEEEELDDEDLIEEEQEEVVEEETTEEYDIEEDVNALLGGEELSEEFKEKARVVFESALMAKVNEIKEALEVEYQEKIAEEVEEIKEALEERVDSYLEYVADEWFTENQLAVEYGLKTEMTESFLEGMKGLFEAHYVSIPEDKYDVLESMVEKLDDMETKLNEQIEKNIQLNQRLAESVADGIFDEISEGLAATQKEKLASLAESVEFESEEEYREKLEMLKESYFPANKAPKAHTETLSEGVDHSTESVSGPMANYLRTLQAVAKN